MGRLIAVTGLLLLLLSAEAAAQDNGKPTLSLQQRLTPARPSSLDALPRWNVQAVKAESKRPAQPSLAGARGQSVALMIAGGAVFLAGAIIGGDAGTLLMVGGAVVGGYGLYLHFL
ncbi:MAG: hypothetical protein ACRENP_14180 [Longimicrobiales bacterium]